MNKGYTYIDGKVIVSDENGIHRQTEYYDNLEQVLVQENLVEEMNKKIRELTEESKRKPINNKKFKPKLIYILLAGLSVGIPVVLYLLMRQNPYLINIELPTGEYNLVMFTTVLAGSIGIPFALGLTLGSYNIFKTKKEIAKGINSELEYLNKQIEIEKEKLSLLQKDKTRNNENKEFKSVRIDDKKELYSLHDKLNLIYNLGANDEKIYEYYQKGKLDKKLRRYYDESHIELAKEYLKEKEPVLVRKKTRSRH